LLRIYFPDVNFQLDDTISQLSPIQHMNFTHFPAILGHGTRETPEFRRQSDDFAAALTAAGKNVTLIVAPGYNHLLNACGLPVRE